METDLAKQLERVAEIENADYSISQAAMQELESDAFTMIFSTLDKQLGQFPQTLNENEFPDYYPRHGISLQDI